MVPPDLRPAQRMQLRSDALPAVVRRAETGEVIRLAGASGPMLGPFDDSIYVDSAVAVKPGDVLVMYTPLAVVGKPGILRVAALQQGQRTARRDGRGPGGLATALSLAAYRPLPEQCR